MCPDTVHRDSIPVAADVRPAAAPHLSSENHPPQLTESSLEGNNFRMSCKMKTRKTV